MSKIHLYGELAEAVGNTEVDIDANTMLDVINGLSQYGPKVKPMLYSQQWVFAVGNDKDNITFIDQRTFLMNIAGKDVWVSPIINGEAPLIISALGITSLWAKIAIYVITTLAVAGLTAALAPKISTPDFKDEPGSNTPTMNYNGAANVQEQGSALPILCGHGRCGSIVIATALETEQLKAPV